MDSPPTEKKIAFISIDMDTGFIIAEETPETRKTEVNPVGHYVRFVDSLAHAKRIKRKLEKRPFLVEEYIKTL